MYRYNKRIIGVLMLFGSLMKIKFLKIFYFDGNFVYFDCCDNKNKRSLWGFIVLDKWYFNISKKVFFVLILYIIYIDINIFGYIYIFL